FRSWPRTSDSRFQSADSTGNCLGLAPPASVGSAKRPGSGVRSQESGVRSQESGVRSQESGVRSQESGVRSQESGVRSQESGVRSQESGVRSQESARWLPTTDSRLPVFRRIAVATYPTPIAEQLPAPFSSDDSEGLLLLQRAARLMRSIL